MILVIDNYDSFTWNLVHYLMELGAEVEVVRNDDMSAGQALSTGAQAFLISPGPKTPNEAGISMDVLKKHFDKMPILGICLGHQAIGILFGATLEKADKPMHGKTSIVKLTPHYLFENISNTTEVMRYHSLILKDIKSPLNVIAKTSNDEVMAIAHENKLLCGIQFHPESVLTPHGFTIISNWIKHVKNLTSKS
jgi:anthranilate synthase component 2